MSYELYQELKGKIQERIENVRQFEIEGLSHCVKMEKKQLKILQKRIRKA